MGKKYGPPDFDELEAASATIEDELIISACMFGIDHEKITNLEKILLAGVRGYYL